MHQMLKNASFQHASGNVGRSIALTRQHIPIPKPIASMWMFVSGSSLYPSGNSGEPFSPPAVPGRANSGVFLSLYKGT